VFRNGARERRTVTAEEKIGQMIAGGFDGTELPAELARAIQGGRIGGVILFGWNVSSSGQVAELTERLLGLSCDPPVWIMVDQECGIVSPLSGVTTFPPGQMAVGAIGSDRDAYWASRITGEKLKVLGFDVVLAPVLDVNTEPENPIIGTRAFSDEPESVSRLGKAMIKGSLDSRVLPVGKHFPGHGATLLDSHEELPVLDRSSAVLRERDLPPFAGAIRAGLPGVMVGHLWFPSLDPIERPATVSPVVVGELLRGELGFDGLVFSDAMEMKGVAEFASAAEAPLLAVQAGLDVLIYVDVENALLAHEVLTGAYRRGELTGERIESSYRRIVSAKARFGGSPGRTAAGEREAVLGREFEAKIEELNRASIHIARGRGAAAADGSAPVVDLALPSVFTSTGETGRERRRKREFLERFEREWAGRKGKSRFLEARELIEAGPAGVERILGGVSQVILLSFSRRATDPALKSIFELVRSFTGRKTLVAVDNPWVAEAAPPGYDIVLCFGFEPSVPGVLVQALTGDPRARTGTSLPVKLTL